MHCVPGVVPQQAALKNLNASRSVECYSVLMAVAAAGFQLVFRCFYFSHRIAQSSPRVLQVMLTYFRVLKRRPPPPALFPAVMEGLAKFVHLVNLDTVQDLLDLLKDLLSEVTTGIARLVGLMV